MLRKRFWAVACATAMVASMTAGLSVNVFAADDSGLGQTYLQCTTKGNTYEMTVHDFEENVEPIIIKTNREYSGGDIPEYIYDFTDILKVGPQNIDEYFNPETGEKIVI